MQLEVLSNKFPSAKARMLLGLHFDERENSNWDDSMNLKPQNPYWGRSFEILAQKMHFLDMSYDLDCFRVLCEGVGGYFGS